MPSPAGQMKPIQLDHTITTTGTIYACPGIAGIVRKIVYFNPVVTTAGSVAISKNTTSLLSTATINNATATYTTPTELTLATTPETLLLKATDYLKAIFTITTGGSYAGGTVTVWIEPIDNW